MSTTETAPAKMPPAKNGLLPYLTVDGALKAADFYKKAFGAEEAYVVPADETGRTMHVHLYINGSSLMLSDAYPEYGHPFKGHEGFAIRRGDNRRVAVATPVDGSGGSLHRNQQGLPGMTTVLRIA
jgi:hypothetical protein